MQYYSQGIFLQSVKFLTKKKYLHVCEGGKHISKSLKTTLQGQHVAAVESHGTRKLLPVRLTISNCA